MKSVRGCLCLALFAISSTVTPSLAQSAVPAPAGPVPPAIRAAKTIFVSNAGADSGLFPQPFSGDTDRAYNQLYSALKADGHFKLVTDPTIADLVLEIQLIAPQGPSEPSKQKGASDPHPMFRLTVYKDHYLLWTITESVDFALLQKTHDRNFDEALSAVLANFLQIAGKSPAAAQGK